MKDKGTDGVHSGHVLVGSEQSDSSVVASVSLHALEAGNQMRVFSALSKQANPKTLGGVEEWRGGAYRVMA